jgi:hypothetical protein
MAGLVPAIPIRIARPCPPKRDARHKAGHDKKRIADFSYSAKLVPQPQEAVAFGFFTLNEAPIRSSTKSISEPAM